jgi:hypothetical protein
MNSLAQSLITLLISPPGNLIYHLVLVFAVAGTAQTIIVGRGPLRTPQARRALVGLVILLLAQAILFLASGLSWQGLLQPSSYLPILDRSMTAFSLLWIAWLWAFPKPLRWADALTTLGSVVIIIMLAFSLVAWNSQAVTASFNASWIDWGWSGISIMISLGGFFLLVMRQTPGWGIGAAMLALNLVGHLAHLVWGLPQGDYSAIIRLTQLCAYPLLPTLAGCLHTASPLQAFETTPAPAALSTDQLGSLETWLQMQIGTNAQRCQALTRAVAEALPADFCLLASVPKMDGNPITIACGFNSVDNLQIARIDLDPIGFPALDSALSSSKMTWIEDNSGKGLDIRILGGLIGLQKTSDMLVLPLQQNDLPWAALLLLSPTSKTKWSNENLQRLSGLSGFMVQILQQTPQGRASKTSIDKPVPAHEESGRQSTNPYSQDAAGDETAAGEPPGSEKDEIIERLQKENKEMNAKFVQLQQDILLLGEQSEPVFSNPAAVAAAMDPSDPGGWEKAGENDALISNEEPSGSESLELTIDRIKQYSQALTAQAETPLIEADNLTDEAANLLPNQMKGRAGETTTEELLSEISTQSELLIPPTSKMSAQKKDLQDELSELERLIALDSAGPPKQSQDG